HCLVLAAFVSPRPDGMQGAHNDGNPANNKLANLRWATPKSNLADRVRHGTLLTGGRNPCAKLTADDVNVIRRLKAQGLRQNAIAARFGVTPANVSCIVRGTTWRSEGGAR